MSDTLSHTAVTSFWGELEKIAAGPFMIEVDDPSLLSGHALNVTAESFLKNPNDTHRVIIKHWPQALEAAKKGRGVVLVPSIKNLEQMPGMDPESARANYKQLRRHELTHWMRKRKGYGGIESAPGLRNVLKNTREEWAAHVSQAVGTRGISDAHRKQIASAAWPGTMSAVAGNYAHMGGVRKAALGGNFGRALRALRVIR